MIDIDKDIEVKTKLVGEELRIIEVTLRLSNQSALPPPLHDGVELEYAIRRSKRRIMDHLYGDIRSELLRIYDITHPYDASGREIRERLGTLINSL